MTNAVADRIERVLGQRPVQSVRLQGGMIADVYRVDLPDGERIVAKSAQGDDATLDIEAYMLRYLAENSRLPVPEVLHSEPTLLLMTFIDGESRLTPSVQAHTADLLADLHSINALKFGLERDTLIGPLHQPNPWTDDWLTFFREQRLLYMAQETAREGALPAAFMRRIEALAGQLHRWIEEPARPSLIHGDLWTTNVLAADGRAVGFIDPALYYAHPEMELAYMLLFNSFGAPFLKRYDELRGISPGFIEERRDLYNLYPLLVHVRIFGAGYLGSVDAILRKFGV